MVDSEKKAAIIAALRIDFETTLRAALKDQSSGLMRRNIVKTSFSYLEAALWALRQICLDADLLKEHNVRLTNGQTSMLQEETYDLKDNGDLKVNAKFLQLGPGFRFTFKMLENVMNVNFNINYLDPRWKDLLNSVRVRNRLTHPKLVEELEVTDDELRACLRALQFFNVAYDAFVARFKEVVVPMRMRGEIASRYAEQLKNN